MTVFSVVKDISPGFGSGLVVSPIHAFPFEHAEEALRSGIVGITSHCAHAAGQLMRLQESLVFFRRKLAAPIRVQNDWGAGRPLPQCHQHRLEDQLAVLTRTHRPAHHETRIQIQHDAHVQSVFGGPNVGNVGHPFGVGSGGTEVPV